MVFICVGNSLTILVFWIVPSLRTTSNMYIVSLAVADFFTGLMVPFLSAEIYPPYEKLMNRNKYPCICRTVFLYTFVGNSLLSMCVIAFDRFIFIKYPLSYNQICNKRKVYVIIAATWMLAIIFGTVPIYYNNWERHRSCDIFYILPSQYRIHILCTAYFVGSFITAVLYGCIIKMAIPQQRRNSLMISRNQVVNIRWWHRDEMRSIRMFTLVFGVFFACWTPSFILIIVGYSIPLSKTLTRVFLLLGVMNSGMNFVIYAFKNQDFRLAFYSVLTQQKPQTLKTAAEQRRMSVAQFTLAQPAATDTPTQCRKPDDKHERF